MNKLLMILALSLSFTAFAGDKDDKYHFGEQTRAWTNLQESGAVSDTTIRPMPGEIADKVYERYVKSFGYAIPESFNRESFVGGGGSGAAK
jgi:hypothetical protein